MSNNIKLFIKVLRFISKPKFNALVKKFQSDAYAFIRISRNQPQCGVFTNIHSFDYLSANRYVQIKTK